MPIQRNTADVEDTNNEHARGRTMKTETQEIKVGTKVIKDGFEGTVVRVCEWDTELVEVRTRGGVSCVCKSTFNGRCENNSVVSY
jgi:hypothetical protein